MTLHLLIRKSQRDDGWVWTSMVFAIDFRLDLTAEEEHLLHKYQLADAQIYDSQARDDYNESSQDSYDKAKESFDDFELFPAMEDIEKVIGSVLDGIWNTLAGATYGLLAGMELQITMRSLMDGQHIESESLDEIVAIQGYVMGALQLLSEHFRTALTFDGSDELHEVET